MHKALPCSSLYHVMDLNFIAVGGRMHVWRKIGWGFLDQRNNQGKWLCLSPSGNSCIYKYCISWNSLIVAPLHGSFIIANFDNFLTDFSSFDVIITGDLNSFNIAPLVDGVDWSALSTNRLGSLEILEKLNVKKGVRSDMIPIVL